MMKQLSRPDRPAFTVALALLVGAVVLLLFCGAKDPRPTDDEMDTIARNTLSTLVSAEMAYYARHGRYASMLELAGDMMISEELAKGGGPENGAPYVCWGLVASKDGQRFLAFAAPIGNGRMAFLADQSGAILRPGAGQIDVGHLSTAPPAEAPAKVAVAPESGAVPVVLETTKGRIVLAVHPEWSPLGVAHFLELVNAGFYDGAPWFRVIDGFVAQCGIASDQALNERWQDLTIADEPVVMGNKRGMVAFGKTVEPNSRSTHFYINYVDNSGKLDPQDFACFAEVAEGMDVADALTRCVFDDQGGLAAPGGIGAFKEMFPEADYIIKAYVEK